MKVREQVRELGTGHQCFRRARKQKSHRSERKPQILLRLFFKGTEEMSWDPSGNTAEKIQITSCYWERFFFLHGTSTLVALGPVNSYPFWVAVLNLVSQWPHSRSMEATDFSRLSVTTWAWVGVGGGGVVKVGDSYLFCKQAGPEILRF